TITGSEFVHNGFSGCADGREAIAIDSSSRNVIAGNYFRDNKLAAISLYKNCGEDDVPRTMYSNDNYIARNLFEYPDNTGRCAAVWVGARQGLGPGDACFDVSNCSDTPASNGRYRDYARGNVIRSNAFVNNLTSIKISDSSNVVENNTFHGTSWRDLDDQDVTHRAVYDVAVGDDHLRWLGYPVQDITMENNVTRTGATNTSDRTFVPLHDAIVSF